MTRFLPTPDTAGRRAAIEKVQQVWNATVPSAILRASEYVVAYADDVHGLTFDHEAITYFDKAYIEP